MTEQKGPKDSFREFVETIGGEVFRTLSEDQAHNFVQDFSEATMHETAADAYLLLKHLKHKDVTPPMIVTEFHATLAYHSMLQWATILGVQTNATEAEFHKNMDNILIAMKREGLRAFKEEKLNRVMRDRERERL